MDRITAPLIPLREIVAFPGVLHPILIGRPFSLKAARHALSMRSEVAMFTQRNPTIEVPKDKDLYIVGTLVRIAQHTIPPDGSMRCLIKGIKRIKLVEIIEDDGYFLAVVDSYPQVFDHSKTVSTLTRLVNEYFRKYLELKPGTSEDVLTSMLEEEQDPQSIANILSAYFPRLTTEERQRLLEAKSLDDQLNNLIRVLLTEIEFLETKRKIEDRVKREMSESQRQYFLQQEMREIQKELGTTEEDEYTSLEEQIKEAKMPKDVEKKAISELHKLRKTPSISPEATVIRNYLDWLIALPWSKKAKDNLDIKHAKRVLDNDHYGLEDQKSRILEYLSVLKLKGKLKGEVICFVGPPGVGKSSLARSIARALGRKFVRMSLGGIHDEAEIRGHRRTYVGALPGRIIQQICRAGTKNPVFLLDEIDKMGRDFRGDPQAALMEVLDPEINKSFVDHYLEVEFDLSEVLFITTANSLYGIPRPLLDRMEVIPIRGYLDHEKIKIAKLHLIPKKLEDTGLQKGIVRFQEKAILKIIQEYTSESGVRELERNIARVLRKTAKEYQGDNHKKFVITPKKVREFLGLPKKRFNLSKPVLPVGVVYGLAWTETGGEILQIEVIPVKGNGNLELTGHLGDIMKESARAALTFIRAHYRELGLDEDFYAKTDIHLHVPAGAIPKDGPSAGLAILLAMISALTKRSVSGEIAVTGEITLAGEILPVGGLKEKLLAAKRAKIKTVFLPKANEPDVIEMEPQIKEGIRIVYVERAESAVKGFFRLPKSLTPTKPPEIEITSWITA